MGKRERAATPVAFRDLLIALARSVATAEAIATTALRCLVASDAASVTLSCDPVWVGPEHREERVS